MILIPLVLLAVIGLLLYRRLVRAPRWRSRRTRVIATVAIVAWMAVMIFSFGVASRVLGPDAARPVSWFGGFSMGVFWYTLIGLLLLALCAGILRLLRRDEADRLRLHRIGVPVVLVLAIAITGGGVLRAMNPEVVAVDQPVRNLPSDLDGLTIALITDTHIGPIRDAGLARKVVDRVNAAEPDLVVFSGDLVDGSVDDFGDLIAPFGDFTAPLGVYAVTGNHEMYTGTIPGWLDRWEDLGITVLANQNASIRVGQTTLHLAGVHDKRGIDPFTPDYDKALEGIDPGDFTVLLAHQPSQVLDAQDRGIDLQLSGHTHGGQVWPFKYLVALNEPLVSGAGVVGDVPIYVSSGAGTWGPPSRVGADPEIPLLTLHPAP